MVLGAGTMGLLHFELAARLGSRVIVVDMNQEYLDLAAQLGTARPRLRGARR
ncbi:MAG: 3-hydroxyacyl-CoA dehydrogenase NAD-binding domain-containing protein [Pseudonocardiaceae bacterium]